MFKIKANLKAFRQNGKVIYYGAFLNDKEAKKLPVVDDTMLNSKREFHITLVFRPTTETQEHLERFIDEELEFELKEVRHRLGSIAAVQVSPSDEITRDIIDQIPQKLGLPKVHHITLAHAPNVPPVRSNDLF